VSPASPAVPGRARGATEGARDATLRALTRRSRGDAVKGTGFYALVALCALIGVAALVALVLQAFFEGQSRLSLDLITEFPSSQAEEAGYQSAIVGSLLIIAGVVVTALPLGIGAAIYLEEYADNTRWYNRAIELNIANLAAVPSIVYGILGLGFIVRGPLSLGSVAYAASLTLSLLVLPIVIISSREALRAVPPSIREGSMALGATKMQTIARQVFPSAVPGMATGSILALSRALGEAAPLLLIGATVFVTFNPDGPFEGRFTAMPVQIFNYVTRPQEEFQIVSAAGIMVMLAILLLVNSSAIILRNRFERKW